jgi:hypothetical protein
MRIIVRRERPHPGAQLSVFEHRDGYRYQTFATNTPHGRGGLAFLEARHRAHARVEDRIRCAKDTGLGRLPSREMAINAAWLELVLTATDLTAWLQTSLLAVTPRWPRQSRKRCDTGCCTPQPGSPGADDGHSSTSPSPGHGPPRWPTHSPACDSFPSPDSPQTTTRRVGLRNPATRRAIPHGPVPKPQNSAEICANAYASSAS